MLAPSLLPNFLLAFSSAKIARQALLLTTGIGRDAVEEFREAVERRCGFDLRDVCPRKRLAHCSAPILFAHAKNDDLVFPYHSERMHDEYVGGYKEKYVLEGNHNSERQEEFLHVAKAFFLKNLAPPGKRKVLGDGVASVLNLRGDRLKRGTLEAAMAMGLIVVVAGFLIQTVQ